MANKYFQATQFIFSDHRRSNSINENAIVVSETQTIIIESKITNFETKLIE